MKGTLNFDANSKRFTVINDNNFILDITSGSHVIIYYEDLILDSSVEYYDNYYLTKYPKISLELLVGSKVELK